MSLFGNIVGKIVSLAEEAVGGGSAKATTTPTAPVPPAAGEPDAPAGAAPQSPAVASPEASSLQSVDIGAVLEKRAGEKGEQLNWQSSIVDLLKLLDLDSSLAARKQLATELDVHAGADGSAEENIALHKAVVAKLEENGGNVPASMKG